MTETQETLINKINALRPTMDVEPVPRKAQLKIESKTFHYDQVREMIQEFEETAQELEEQGVVGLEAEKVLIEGTALGGLDDWNDEVSEQEARQALQDEESGTPSPSDFMDDKSVKLIKKKFKELSTTINQENKAFNSSQSKRLVKGRILHELLEVLEEQDIGNPRKYIQSQMTDLGLAKAGSLSSQEFTWTISSYLAFFKNHGDDIGVEITHSDVVAPDSDVPMPFRPDEISVQKLYVLSSLVTDKESRDKLAAFAYLNSQEDCQALKNLRNARQKQIDSKPTNIHEAPVTDAVEIIDEIANNPNDDNDAYSYSFSQTASDKIKEARGETVQKNSEFVTVKIKRQVMDYLNDPTDESGIKGMIDRNYPQKEDDDEHTGIRASITSIIELLYYLPDILGRMNIELPEKNLKGRDVLEEAFAEMRRENQ